MVEEPKQLGEIVIEIAGEKLQVAECENGMLLCSENGAGKKKVDCDTFKQELKEKLMRTTEKSSVQARTAAVLVKRVHKLLKRQERLGETSINTAGEKMEIVQYNGCEDMTVRFEDGTEKEGVKYEKFKKGNLRKPKRESVGNKEFLQRAEAYLVSAKALLEGNESMLVPSVVLCKKAAIDFLKSALESRTEGKTSKGETEDIRCLGREVKEKTSVSLDPRDLAWLNDFNFKQEESWLQPTTEDVTMAIEIVEKIGREVNKVVPKT